MPEIDPYDLRDVFLYAMIDEYLKSCNHTPSAASKPAIGRAIRRESFYGCKVVHLINTRDGRVVEFDRAAGHFILPSMGEVSEVAIDEAFTFIHHKTTKPGSGRPCAATAARCWRTTRHFNLDHYHKSSSKVKCVKSSLTLPA